MSQHVVHPTTATVIDNMVPKGKTPRQTMMVGLLGERQQHLATDTG
jgi:hypothetical protein